MSTNWHTPILPDAAALPATFNDPLGQLDDAITRLGNGATAITPVLARLNLGASTALVIAAGAIAVTGPRHAVDTEGGLSSDDLDTVNGGGEGDLLLLQCATNSRAVVVKHLIGNLYLKTGADTTLNDTRKVIVLLKSGVTWVEV